MSKALVIAMPETREASAIEWRLIPGYPEYIVSEYGHVKRASPGKGAIPGKILRPRVHTAGGYLRYTLRAGGRSKHEYAHRCVALAFIGPPPVDAPEVAHTDGDARNNHASNLRWVARQENVNDAWLHGTMARGEKIGTSVLGDEDVLALRRAYAADQSRGCFRRLAREYGVHPQTIAKICHRTAWKYL